ncbi:MAG: alanine--glyoxylate aminotransferase family protein [Gemmatimonadales bacterium]|nr:alanine--glyoxylate aminotransferase family protein [Gemmatimonadales bacterium]
MTYGRHFLATVADVHPELRAILQDEAPLPPAALTQALARATLRLRALFRTAEPVLTIPGSAALVREIGLQAVVEHRALVVVAGAEGDALAAAAEALGKEVIRVVVHPGQVLEPAHLTRFLCGPEVDSVVLSHVDLATGALAPLADLARVVRARREVLLYVDAVGTLGATPLETDQWGLDFVVGSSEGPLGLPPGLAFAAASPRLLARVRTQPGRGMQLDVAAHHAAASRGQTLGPVPAALVRALDRQLERILDGETLERRWARHAALAAQVDDWLAGQPGVRLLAAAGRRASACSCLELPPELAAVTVVAALAEEGWFVTPATVSDPRVLRIGHQGDMTSEHLAGLLDALGRRLGR